MDGDTKDQANSGNSSLRRRSLNISVSVQLDNDTESESVSEAGDIGDRAILSNRHSGSGRIRFSFDNVTDHSCVVPIQEDANDLSAPKSVSTKSSLPLHTLSPVPADTKLVQRGDEKQQTKWEMPWLLAYISCLLHLAVFGILGVLTRYLLQKLFGPGGVGATSDKFYMYLDLPSNMVGSFLMGWLGVVFKGVISEVSDHLAIGLSTGYLGSLTTFSGWNQKMLDLSVKGQWVFAVLGYFIGLFLVAYSIIFGIETAEGFKWMMHSLTDSKSGNSKSKFSPSVSSFKAHLAVMVVLLLALSLLWGLSGALERREFHSGSREACLWLACMVGPLGVWIRWFLARLNGRGLGEKGYLKWVPFGTLVANVSAACVMAALAVLRKAVNTQNFNTVASGLQFGLMGCLSTVSTFIAEFHAMRQSNHPWRAYAYAMTTILASFCMGTLIYSVPVWVKGYD